MRSLKSGAAVFVLSVGVLLAAAQPPPPQTGESPPDSAFEKIMREYEKLAAPGAEHAVLARLAGEWSGTTTIWPGPGKRPVENPPGMYVGELIFGGRFLLFRESGRLMGMPVEGMGLLGYDKIKQRYQLVWADNTATAIYTAAGKADSSGNVITLEGKVDDVLTGMMNKDVKYVYRFVDDKTVIFEMWDGEGGGRFSKSFETTYRRK